MLDFVILGGTMKFAKSAGIFAVILSLASMTAVWSAAAQDQHKAQIDALRKSLEKYQDYKVAVRDLYLSTVGCVHYSGEKIAGHMEYAKGAMGVHFLNLQVISPTLDPAKPQVLIYEPVGDRLRLAAAEWFVPTEVAGTAHPAIFGQKLQGPMEGHVPLQPKGLHHYDLHVWLWKDNPAGVFSPTNPAIKCPKGSYSFTEQAPKLVDARGH